MVKKSLNLQDYKIFYQVDLTAIYKFDPEPDPHFQFSLWTRGQYPE